MEEGKEGGAGGSWSAALSFAAVCGDGELLWVFGCVGWRALVVIDGGCRSEGIKCGRAWLVPRFFTQPLVRVVAVRCNGGALHGQNEWVGAMVRGCIFACALLHQSAVACDSSSGLADPHQKKERVWVFIIIIY